VRAQALALIVPEGAAVTDWTACWLYTGFLPPNDHLTVPPVCVYRFAGRGRLRNDLCRSGERTFLPEDLTQINGLTVTTPLRTALDLGRLAPRDHAIAALDALLRHGTFTSEELVDGVERFRGDRGVIQLRGLAPLADPRAESAGESVLRLRWRDLPSLPPPTPQVPIFREDGTVMYWIDLGVPEIRFGSEYDGEPWHSDDEDVAYDAKRRRYLDERERWTIRPVRRHNVYGPTRDVEAILYEGVATARKRLGRYRPPR
jgi:hypothetical protein